MKNQRLERFSFDDKGQISRPQWMLDDLKQRIRDVRQGPDGLLYVLTDEDAGALLQDRAGARAGSELVTAPSGPTKHFCPRESSVYKRTVPVG